VRKRKKERKRREERKERNFFRKNKIVAKFYERKSEIFSEKITVNNN
jgi:hypothetical protein